MSGKCGLRTMARNTIALPQVSSGVVKKVLLAIWREMPEAPISKEWLEQRRFSQTPQILDMLTFLGLLERSSDRLTEEIRASRGNAKGFYKSLRGMAVSAYAGAGLGTAETLGWFGRDRLNDRQLRATIEGRGPFRQLDPGIGGAKNARSCIKGLHEFLIEWKRRHAGKRARSTVRGEAEPPSRSPADQARSGTEAGARQTHVVHERFPDLQAARDFVRQLPDIAQPEQAEDANLIRVPFSDARGVWTTAIVCFQAQPRAAHLVELGRMLQVMGEEMKRRPAP